MIKVWQVIIITSSNPKWVNHLVFPHYNASTVFQLVYSCYSSKASTIWSNMKCCFRSYKQSKFASLITLCSISLTIQCNSAFAANLVTSTSITSETVNRVPCAPIPMVKVGTNHITKQQDRGVKLRTQRRDLAGRTQKKAFYTPVEQQKGSSMDATTPSK